MKTKPLDEMTVDELRAMTTLCLNAIKERLPDGTGFVLVYFPFGGPGTGHYGSNCNRDDVISTLRATADSLEGRKDSPR